MPLYFLYTMVQKSQKWPKTQIKGGPALKPLTNSEQLQAIILAGGREKNEEKND